MRLKNSYQIRIVLLPVLYMLLALVSCGKKRGSGIEDIPLKPQKSSLIYPNQNEACLSGKLVTSSMSEITFSWSVGGNTKEYEINVKNLLSGEVLNKVTKETSIPLTLAVNTPYSWFVVSRNGTDHVQSDSWKFYNIGPAIAYYPPFPADKLSPTMGQTLKAANSKITLSWEGGDADHDISGYDLYFGQSTVLTLYKTDLQTLKIDVEVSAGITYYWKIVTKDSKGNSSDSGIYRFTID